MGSNIWTINNEGKTEEFAINLSEVFKSNSYKITVVEENNSRIPLLLPL